MHSSFNLFDIKIPTNVNKIRSRLECQLGVSIGVGKVSKNHFQIRAMTKTGLLIGEIDLMIDAAFGKQCFGTKTSFFWRTNVLAILRELEEI